MLGDGRILIIVSVTRRWMLEQLREAFTLTGDAASRSWSTYLKVILSLGEMFHLRDNPNIQSISHHRKRR